MECWVCGSKNLKLKKESNVTEPLSSKNFAITDQIYGKFLSIYECVNCEFMQCTESDDVLLYYQQMDDPTYESGREYRKLQIKKILNRILKVKKKWIDEPRLLDIGAGSGIMVEAAEEMNLKSEGIEPSMNLCNIANKKGLKVYNGVLPNEMIKHKYDIVTIIDVIEHVNNPRDLLTEAKKCMKSEGILVIVTPNLRSLVAHLFGWRWWHFRIAHIGYFNANNLKMICERAGLEIINSSHPGWVFDIGYLNDRIKSYIPQCLHIPTAPWMNKIKIPLNLFDSLMFIARLKQN